MMALRARGLAATSAAEAFTGLPTSTSLGWGSWSARRGALGQVAIGFRLILKETLDDAVFQGMEGNDHQPTARLEQFKRLGQG